MENGGAMTLRILIVEDHALVSQGLEVMLSACDDLEVAGAVGTAAHAIDVVTKNAVDVVLMDVNLGRTISGLEATRQIKRVSPDTKVLVLTMYSDTETVSEAIRSGADGYLTKAASRDAVVRGIRDVAASRSVLDPNVTGGVFGRLSERDPHALSDRELTILQQISHGKSTREIAREVSLAEETVKTHLKQIFKKLGVRDRTEAAAEGLRRHLIH
jgi:DNA-binding NarL/FixJ family response regulator